MKKNKTNSVALNEKLVEELISFGYSRSEILDSIYSLNKDNEGNNNNNNNNNVLRRVDVIKELEKRKEERLKEKNKLEEENKKQNQNNNSNNNNNQDDEENMCKICFEETINCVIVPVSKLELLDIFLSLFADVIYG